MECKVSDVSFIVDDVELALRSKCGLGDVVCDMKMSCETSYSTEEFIYRNFWGDALFCSTAFVTVGCSV